jgi:NTE family protein
MALHEERTPATEQTRRPVDCLRACSVLTGIDAAALDRLAEVAVCFCLPAGAVLFERGSRSDGIFLVANGLLGVRREAPGWAAQIGAGGLAGEVAWLLGGQHGAAVVAVRDSELLFLPGPALTTIAAGSAAFSLALARLCAERLATTQALRPPPVRTARIFTIVPNGPETDVAQFATDFVESLNQMGRALLVWDVRANAHTSDWFQRIEASHDYVVYLSDPTSSAWTRQCCRQADVLLLAGTARDAPGPWPAAMSEAAARPSIRSELVLLHPESFESGAATRWLAATDVQSHHHVADAEDIARLARLVTHRGVGLVLSGGGARGFAHLGVIRALREAGVPIDCVGGTSIGSIIAAGAAMQWTDAEMLLRYRRAFVDTNPVDDYAFPFVALTRGHKVSRLLQREFGSGLIEDLRVPFFCVSANLTTGLALEHRRGPVWEALRASAAIPGVLPPVLRGEDVLVDGAAIANLPIRFMHDRVPGFIIGSDVGGDRSFTADYEAADQPPFWRWFARRRDGRRRINIFQILMRSGMVGGESLLAAQRELADLILKPPLTGIDLLNWHALERAAELGYVCAREALQGRPDLPRIAARSPAASSAGNSLCAALERRRRQS